MFKQIRMLMSDTSGNNNGGDLLDGTMFDVLLGQIAEVKIMNHT